MRVEAKIPGGVRSFCVDALGNRQSTDAHTWNEAFLSSMLRSIFQADKKCAGRRNLSALLSAKLEMKFLGLAAEYFESGWKLGSPDGPSIANAANNYLTRGVVEYFSATGRPEIAIGFLKQQLPNHPSLSGLLFGCLIKAGTMAGLGICKLANLIFYITSHHITFAANRTTRLSHSVGHGGKSRFILLWAVG